MSRPACTFKSPPASTRLPYWVTLLFLNSPLTRIAVGPFGRDQVDVAPGLERGVGAAAHHAAHAVYVAAGLQAQVVRSFDARCTVHGVGVLGAVAAAAVVAGDAALVEDVALGDGQVHVATGDAAGGVDDGVTGQQIEAVTGLDQAAVGQVVAGLGRQVIASPQGADVVQVLAGDQVDASVTGDQRAVRGQAVIRLGQVHHGYQDVFAVYLLFFKPDDVVGQRRDLG